MPITFEWDEPKRLVNLAKHGIDFVEAKDIWANDVLEAPSPRYAEERYIAYGILDDRIVAVVFMRQGQRLRLISARRARDYERKAYKDAFGRGS